MQHKVFSSIVFTTIPLLFIHLSLDGVQAVQPQNCICYNPSFLDSNNSTVSCNTTHCSRGNNPNCHANYPEYTIIQLRAFGYSNDIVTYIGCNCPGYNYSNSTYDNAIAYSSNGAYTYTDCDGFGGDEHDDDATYCCNYCCGLLPVHTTTHVPGATSSIYVFPISILFSLVLVCMKMVTNCLLNL